MEDLEMHWSSLGENAMRQLGRNFHPPTRLKRLLLMGFTKWLATAALGVISEIVHHYSHEKAMDEMKKANVQLSNHGRVARPWHKLCEQPQGYSHGYY
jgi:hypothetical protein